METFFDRSAWKTNTRARVKILLVDLRRRFATERPNDPPNVIDWRVLDETHSILNSPELIKIHEEATTLLDADLEQGFEPRIFKQDFGRDFRAILDEERRAFNAVVFDQQRAKLSTEDAI